MTIAETIETLQADFYNPGSVAIEEVEEAEEIAIEILKAVITLRKFSLGPPLPILQGETKE